MLWPTLWIFYSGKTPAGWFRWQLRQVPRLQQSSEGVAGTVGSEVSVYFSTGWFKYSNSHELWLRV